MALTEEAGKMEAAKKLNESEAQVGFILDSIVCCICMERPRDAFIIPCGHSFCMVCASAQESQQPLKQCSICRGTIVGVGQIRG